MARRIFCFRVHCLSGPRTRRLFSRECHSLDIRANRLLSPPSHNTILRPPDGMVDKNLQGTLRSGNSRKTATTGRAAQRPPTSHYTRSACGHHDHTRGSDIESRSASTSCLSGVYHCDLCRDNRSTPVSSFPRPPPTLWLTNINAQMFRVFARILSRSRLVGFLYILFYF